MGRPNVAILSAETILTPFYSLGLGDYLVRPLFLAVLVTATVMLLAWFLATDFGLAMRATGANPRMARAQGIGTDRYIYAGMALSNGLVGLAGALFAQTNGFADVTSGVGTIVVGLAAVIIGETILRFRGIWVMLVGCVVGSIVYRIAIQFALTSDIVGLRPSDLNLATAVLVALALILPRLRKGGVST
jgi:putative ABC transport system permease protein